MSKFIFNIVEIPEGESSRDLVLDTDDLDLDPYVFEQGVLHMNFYRARHFIRVGFQVEADVKLTCDRSLEQFTYPVEANYDIVFKTDVEDETEDENGAVRRFNFHSNTLSIEEEVRDSILLEIPMQTVHPKYLDEEGNIKEFETKTFGEAADEEEHDGIDPRWEKLKKLQEE